MADNRRDTIYDVWARILVAANLIVTNSGRVVNLPPFLSEHSTPNRRDTLWEKQQKTLAAFNSLT